MVQEFPVEIKTKSNYQAKVTNPEPGLYHFEVTYPTAYEPFEWVDNSYKGEHKPQAKQGQKDNIDRINNPEKYQFFVSQEELNKVEELINFKLYDTLEIAKGYIELQAFKGDAIAEKLLETIHPVLEKAKADFS